MAQFDYSKKRYWYHLSYSLDRDEIEICPWDKRTHRSAGEPDGRRLCVAPSVAHCLTALPHREKYYIYRTPSKFLVEEPDGVYDSEITKEGWITQRIKLIRIGTIDLTHIEKELGWLPIEAAKLPRMDWCKRCFREWNRIADLYMESYVGSKSQIA